MSLTSKPSKYPYKARQNALLSIQLYEGQGPIDLKMVSNLSDTADKLFPPASYDFDAKRHGKFAADFIKDHADGKALVFLARFIEAMNEELNPYQPAHKSRKEKVMSKEEWKITREANDPLALRLSIGGVDGELGYIVYRGETAACLKLLRKALTKLEAHYKEQGE